MLLNLLGSLQTPSIVQIWACHGKPDHIHPSVSDPFFGSKCLKFSKPNRQSANPLRFFTSFNMPFSASLQQT